MFSASTVAWVLVQTTSATNSRTWINANTGAIGTVSVNHTDVSVTDLGDGWRRVRFVMRSGTQVIVRLANADNGLTTTIGFSLGLRNMVLTQHRISTVKNLLGPELLTAGLSSQPRRREADGWILGPVWGQNSLSIPLSLATLEASIIEYFQWPAGPEPFSWAVVRECPTPIDRTIPEYPLGGILSEIDGSFGQRFDIAISTSVKPCLIDVRAIVADSEFSEAAPGPSPGKGVDLWIWDGVTLRLYDETNTEIPISQDTLDPVPFFGTVVSVRGDAFGSAVGALYLYDYAISFADRVTLLQRLDSLL